jgi:hypothetical protein
LPRLAREELVSNGVAAGRPASLDFIAREGEAGAERWLERVRRDRWRGTSCANCNVRCGTEIDWTTGHFASPRRLFMAVRRSTTTLKRTHTRLFYSYYIPISLRLGSAFERALTCWAR